MGKRTIAVLVLFWSMATAILWAGLYPPLSAWVTAKLAGFEPHQAMLIATGVAGACPPLAATLVTFLAALLARPTSATLPQSSRAREVSPRGVQAQPAGAFRPIVGAGPAGQLSVPVRTDGAISSPFWNATSSNRAARRLICIKPDKTLVHSGLRFGLVRVAGDRGQDHGGLSEEIYFKKRDECGTLIAQVPNDGRAFQFKCFVDYRGTKFDRVKNALSAAGFTTVTPRPNNQFRVWFVLPNYRICKTSADQRYNVA